jgi:hypothetical protein
MDARGVGAVIASQDREMSPDVGKLADLHGLDPRAVDTQRNVVFRFAGGATGVAPDAFGLIDDPGVIHGRILIPLRPKV